VCSPSPGPVVSWILICDAALNWNSALAASTSLNCYLCFFSYCARAQCKLKHISFQQENRRSKKWWRASLELCLLNKFFSLQSIGLALCSNSIRACDQLLPCSSSPLTFEHFIYWKISFTGEYILQSDDFIYSLRKVYAIHSSIRRLHRRLICFRKGAARTTNHLQILETILRGSQHHWNFQK